LKTGSVAPKLAGCKNFCRVTQSPATVKLKRKAIIRLRSANAPRTKRGVTARLQEVSSMVRTLSSSLSIDILRTACKSAPLVSSRFRKSRTKKNAPTATLRAMSEKTMVANTRW